MNLNKKHLAIALSSLIAMPSFAASVDVYGKASLTAQSSDDGNGSFSEIKSNNSNVGLKGIHDLGDGLSVIYKAEFGVDMANESKEKNFSARNQYVGLKGNFGEVLIGRNDTILKQSQGKVDVFNNLEADIKVLWKGENRMSHSITYKSPKFSGFQLGGTFIAEGNEDGESGTSLALMYGDKGLKKSAFYAAVAIDSDVNGYDVTRLSGQTKVAGIKLGAMFQTQEPANGGTEVDGFLVSAAYAVDKVTFKAQLQTAEVDGGDDRSGTSVGVDYKLSKQAKVFAFYSTFDMDSSEDKNYTAVGLEYKF